MAFELLTKQAVTIQANAEDAEGTVLADPGARTWVSSDETVITVAVDPDSGVATVTSGDTAGVATVSLSDVEPSDAGGLTLAGAVDFIVSARPPADPITQIALVVGTPTDV